jgi:hypothetical protein
MKHYELGEVKIIEYGRGLAVIGETKPLREKLKLIGGRFNPKLSCGMGWIFRKSKLELIIKTIYEL